MSAAHSSVVGAKEPLGLREALSLSRSTAEAANETALHRVGVACSFTPLHFETFVHAYVVRDRPDLNVVTETGIYGDLPGTIDQLADDGIDSCVVAIEWSDLDPRLGWRESVGAPIGDLADVATTAQQRLDRIATRLDVLGTRCRTAVVLPTLDLPAAYEGGAQGFGRLRARLNLLLAEFADRVVAMPGVVLVEWDGTACRDLRSEIRSGFPYPIAHASALAAACVEVLFPRPIKKGLITDLDDTLWRGLVGEIGPESVSWDLDSGSQVHALYQQLLAALAERGVLLAVASKNDPEVAQAALSRPDLIVSADRFFPVVVSWGPKSLAVDAILAAWNIAASDVLFVDDNPMELAEVAARHPDITPIRFDPADPSDIAETLRTIAGFLWREVVADDDRLRLDSLRKAGEVALARDSAENRDEFLADLAGRITIRTGSWQETRTRELVNKTNQFNLNGKRFDEAQWQRLSVRPGAFVWSISYEDRFGPLGVIGVLAGVAQGKTATVDCWVLSCRAFSRAIEHHVLASLTKDFDTVAFAFSPTDRNGVLSSLLDRVAPADEQGLRVLDEQRLMHDAPISVHRIDRPSDTNEESS
jgi:FkbH-like protein